MRDLNGDGIPDGAEVELKAKWVKSPARGGTGAAYAGESRGGFTDVGRTTIENTMRGGGDDADAALAGIRAERDFQPMQVMDQGRQLQGPASDVMGMMDRGRAIAAVGAVPMARTGTTEMEGPSPAMREGYDRMENNTNAAVRVMTGGQAGGQKPDQGEREAYSRRIMGDMSQSVAKRQAASAEVQAIMGDKRQEKQLVSDQRIQEILSGGKVQEAQAQAGAVTAAAKEQAGAARYKAEQDRMGTEAQAGAVKYGADKSLEGQLATAKATLEGTKYGADQETLRAREAARATLEGIRVRMAGGAYQGEMVHNEAGYVGIWDDKTMDYKWEKPPASEAPTEIPQPGGGVIRVGGKGSNVDIKALPLWKANGRAGGATGGAAAPRATPNQSQIEMLRKNPAMARDFDAKFGEGASAQYLNR